jgi:type IX secretion system PorP/SprF family membrane protein
MHLKQKLVLLLLFDKHTTMQNRIIILSISIFINIYLVGQSNIRFNSFSENLYTINPASINDSYVGEMTMGMRKQWVNFPGSPKTIFAYATLYAENLNTQFGLKVLADKIGYNTISEIDISYAYAVYLNSYWQLNMGIAMGFQTFGYDISKVEYAVANDPRSFEQLISDNNVNTDLGFEFSNSSWKLGMSSQNFLSLFDVMNINELHENTNIAYVFYKQNNIDFINFGGGITGIQTKNLLQAELNLNAYFKKTNTNNAFQLGAFYRTWHEMGLLLGIQFDRMKIYYSYDFNVGEIYRKSVGSHEIVLSYKFNKTYKCRTCWE